jgi:hypothetical protein
VRPSGTHASTCAPCPRPTRRPQGVLTVMALFIVAEGVSQTGGLDILMNKVLGNAKSVFWAQVRMMVNTHPAPGGVALLGPSRLPGVGHGPSEAAPSCACLLCRAPLGATRSSLLPARTPPAHAVRVQPPFNRSPASRGRAPPYFNAPALAPPLPARARSSPSCSPPPS